MHFVLSSAKLNYIKLKYEGLALLARGKYTSIDELNQVSAFVIRLI